LNGDATIRLTLLVSRRDLSLCSSVDPAAVGQLPELLEHRCNGGALLGIDGPD
jgi:hypothetical protein